MSRTNTTKLRNSMWKKGMRTCMWCGCSLKMNEATLEHIYPRSKGGCNKARNLGIACKECNEKKGTKVRYNPYKMSYKKVKIMLRKGKQKQRKEL